MSVGYQFFTVTFENITDAANFKISDIDCTQPSGAAWKDSGSAAQKCTGNVFIRKIDAEGSYGQQYKYYGNTDGAVEKMGWFVGDRASDFSNKVIGESEVTLSPGEGLIVYASKAAKFRIAGGVRLTATSTDVAIGYQFGGNCTPVALKLSDIGCTQPSGAAWKDTGSAAQKCTGNIFIRKIDAEGSYGQQYKYYGNTDGAAEKMGWFIGDRASDFSNKVIGANEVTFAPGEGWILYASKEAKLVIPAPISE